MHATAGRPPRNFQVVCSRPPWHMPKRHAICRSQSCFSLPSVFALASNEHTHLEGCENWRLVHFTHKPNIEQQLIWARHLSGWGPTDFDVYFHKRGGGRICQNNGLSILRTTCCLFWWEWKSTFFESFESVNSRRKTPSCVWKLSHTSLFLTKGGPCGSTFFNQ